MKKLLIAIAIISISLTTSYATEVEATTQTKTMAQNSVNSRAQKESAFEKRLGLTDEQKAKAKEIRLNGHEKLKPVMDEIMAKKQEAKMVKMSRIAVQVQEERLTAIDAELKILEKKAHEIRKSNMKEFESILTREQKKTLNQMKKEGRQRYHANHPCGKPMMPPPQFNK